MLASQHKIDHHIKIGLVGALKDKKKRRHRGKRLNLSGEDDSGPQFFSPGRVQAARDYQDSKEAEEAQRQRDIQDKKVAAANKKVEKDKEKIQKAAAAVERRRKVEDAKTRKAVFQQLLQEAKQDAAERKKMGRALGTLMVTDF